MLSTEELQGSEYGQSGVEVPIDYVWSPGQTYAEIVGDKRFENVVSVHSIEHVPCLVTYLRNVYEILNPNGRFIIIIPHRSYMFDHYRDRSTLGEVVACYLEGQTQPNLKQLLDARLMISHNYPQLYWNGSDNGAPKIVSAAPEDLAMTVESVWESRGEYTDCHAWVYDEVSFPFIIESLAKLLMTEFQIEEVRAPLENQNEFMVVLRRP